MQPWCFVHLISCITSCTLVDDCLQSGRYVTNRAVVILLDLDGNFPLSSAECESQTLHILYYICYISVFRTLPSKYMEKIVNTISKLNISALLVIGGFEVRW